MGINETLFSHISTGAGAAWILRQRCPDLVDSVRRFFETRTDLSRSEDAEQVAKLILAIHGLDEFAALRRIVAKQELMRHIQCEKQTDHTAHTVYLYLLGVWFYDNLPTIKNAVDDYLNDVSAGDEQLKVEVDTNRVYDFLFAWSYASLLHDIGYVFYDLSPRTKADRESVDGIYGLAWLLDQYPNATDETKILLRSIRRKFYRRYKKKMPPQTSKYAEDAYAEVIYRLAAIPWAGDLHEPWASKNGFQILDPDDTSKDRTRLERFALAVADSGYDGAGGGKCVDHAVASGLLLLQYATYWYWLMHEVRMSGDADAIKEVLEGFDYETENLVRYAVPACRATAYHNVQPKVAWAKRLLRDFRLDHDPLLFLSVLCDELQRWDRFAAGAGHLENWEEYSQYSLESGDMELRLQGLGQQTKAEISIRSPLFKTDQLVATLSDRLIKWDQVVDLTAVPTEEVAPLISEA